jgi:serine/threonine protein kinase/tetratricopeptide (TPR) repeat protein
MPECPPAEELRHYLDPDDTVLDADRRRSIEEHVETCTSCQELLSRWLDDWGAELHLNPQAADEGDGATGVAPDPEATDPYDPAAGLRKYRPYAALRKRQQEVPQGIDTVLREISNLTPLLSSPPPAIVSNTSPSSQRFDILHLHAKGGLGQVSIALDRELDRQVALKEIQDHHADDPDSRARFLREAEITGKLEHPGIVPVYGSGHDAAGRPFYAMRLIRGVSLKDALQRFYDLPTASPDHGAHALRFRELLNHFLDACDAIDYAHSRGVIHRDIKPGNVMLGPFGETLVVDWGLAKAMGRAEDNVDSSQGPVRLSSVAEASPATGTGTLIGTPGFMSPEQIQGRPEHLGPSSDIYSLGATLYVLLTGRTPLPATDLPKGLRRVQRGEIPPPRSVRPGVPRPLEAISRKAMAVRPQDRYASVRELGADVRRWLADEPVSAWREPPHVRARRWVGRHRTTVAIVAASLLITLILGGSFWLWKERRERALLKKAEIALQEAHLRLDQAKRALVDLTLWDLALGAARQAAGLLETIDDRHARRQGRTLLSEIEGGRGYAEAVRAMLDRFVELRISEEDHLTGYGPHAGYDGADAGYAVAFLTLGLDREAFAVEDAARAIRELPDPVVWEVIAALDDWAALCRFHLGDVAVGRAQRLAALTQKVDPDPWRNHLRNLIIRGRSNDQSSALRHLAETARIDELSAQSLSLLGRVLMSAGDPDSSARFLGQARHRYPSDVWINYYLGFSYFKMKKYDDSIRYFTAAQAVRPETAHVLGHVLELAGRRDEAIDLFQDLAQSRLTVGAHFTCLGLALKEQGRIQEARRAFERAILVCRETVLRRPLDPLAHSSLGEALASGRNFDEAIAVYRRSLELRPSNPDVLFNLGCALHDNGDIEGALAAYQRVLGLRPEDAEAWSNYGFLRLEQGRFEEAREAFQEAVRLQPSHADFHNNLGVVLDALGASEQALDAFHEALRLQPRHANAHQNVGNVRLKQRMYGEAIEALRRSLQIRPGDPKTLHLLGDALTGKGDLRGAEATYREVIRLQPAQVEAHFKLGSVLLQTNRDLDRSIAELREVIRLQPAHARAYCILGHALRRAGRFQDALSAFERGHVLGRKEPSWTFPSERWVRECKHLVSLDRQLPRFLNGEIQPADVSQITEYVLLCYEKKRYALAARIYRDALVRAPDLARNPAAQHRYNAACMAALAATGQDEEPSVPRAEAQARWRTQALEWLDADLASWTALCKKGSAADLTLIQQTLQHWQCDPDLSSLRDESELAKLPREDQEVCRALWDKVRSLLRRVAAPAQLPANVFDR